MEVVRVINSPEPILDGLNFTHNEFWLPCCQSFDLYRCVPLALQEFRNYFSEIYGYPVKWHVTSTYRPWDSPSMPKAHRVLPPAVDSVSLDHTLWPEICSRIRQELKQWEESEMVRKVLGTGINVVIIENSCLHIHWRDYSLHNTKQYGKIYLGEWSIDSNDEQINIAYSYSNV